LTNLNSGSHQDRKDLKGGSNQAPEKEAFTVTQPLIIYFSNKGYNNNSLDLAVKWNSVKLDGGFPEILYGWPNGLIEGSENKLGRFCGINKARLSTYKTKKFNSLIYKTS
jgi:hypothetical protein